MITQYVGDYTDIHAIGKVDINNIKSIIKVSFTQESFGMIIMYGDGSEKHKEFNNIDSRNRYFYGMQKRLLNG